jgi:uncharacterized membrane protein YeiH
MPREQLLLAVLAILALSAVTAEYARDALVHKRPLRWSGRTTSTVVAHGGSLVLVWVADRLWHNDDDQHEIARTFGAARLKVRAA